MKDILDIVILVLFVLFVVMFIIGFNRQQVQKHKDKLDEIEKMNAKENKDD